MNLQQLRDYIRTQLDMDDEELPNALLDGYLSEAYQRTIAMEDRWPFFEAAWTVAKVPDSMGIVLPVDCDPPGITSLVDASTSMRLVQVGMEVGEDRYATQAGAPLAYSIFAGQIWLWPKPNTDATYGYLLRGHRLPSDWIAAGPDSEVDADVRLHILLAHYAIALVYAMEEDEVLEDVYMRRFTAGWTVAHSAICEPRHHRPVVLNGGAPPPSGVPSVELVLPAS